MHTAFNSGERFRKGFVLAMTIAYAVAFLAMIGDFFEALLLAAVFSGIVHPLYLWLREKLGGRSTLASLLALVIVLVALVLPLITLLGLVADQAAGVAEAVKPWLEQQLSEPAKGEHSLPSWVPFADELAPYRDDHHGEAR